LGKDPRFRARQSHADIRRVFRFASNGYRRTDRRHVGVGGGSVAPCAKRTLLKRVTETLRERYSGYAREFRPSDES